jgi:hypothetical protein
VDNNGRDNYIVFQFSQDVVVDKAFLGYVVGDSDLTVYVGSSSTAITSMNNAKLASMDLKEFNDTSSTSARWADFNAGKVEGNVLIIAARDDGHCVDYFKVEQLVFQAVQQSDGIYSNKATVTVGSLSDSDLSHYKAVEAAPVLTKVGDYVWEDSNFNGIQDSGEKGIANVTVRLLSSTGSILKTTTTDVNGKYGFDVLAGNYMVEVVRPSGYLTTKQDQGSNNLIDSDINASGRTALFTVNAGQDNLTLDAGLYRKASIGDRVWEDSDHDGIQDAGEFNIANVKVMLQNSSGTTIATTYTNSTGNYKFVDLDPGVYRLVFDKSNVWHKSYWGSTFNMNDWFWNVKANVGTNDNIDSDVLTDGTKKNVVTTNYTTLESGENDMSWDAAITPIVIDLNGDGIKTIARADAKGSFDLLGNGKAIQSGWLSADDGFLAVDNNGNGQIDDISELFGGTSKGTGFAKLADFDSNADGLVNANDTDFSSLLIWQDLNGNHQSDDGELLSLSDAGVSELVVGFTELPFMDAQGNLHFERSSATLVTGQTVDMTDVYFNISKADATAAGIEVDSIADLLADTGYFEQTVAIEPVGVATLEPVFLG